jgi:hypothetical protein
MPSQWRGPHRLHKIFSSVANVTLRGNSGCKPWRGTALSEFVPLDLQAGYCPVGSVDYSRDHQLQVYAPIEQGRPVDRYVEPLSWATAT